MGLSARSLSDRIGFSPSYISKVESGELDPSFDAFAKIATALNFTPAEIVFVTRVESKNREGTK